MRIMLETAIGAPPSRCFDLSRDLDLHVRTMARSRERAVAGRTSGLIGDGEGVTWEGRHFAVLLRPTSRITRFDPPRHFRDSMVRGRFARFEHDHYFEPVGEGTLMRDVLEFESPFGLLGGLVDRLVLNGYLRGLLMERARIIKGAAEGAG